MRTQTNQVRTPLADLVDDVFDQAVGRAFELHRVDRDPAVLDPGLCRRRDLHRAVLDALPNVTGHGAIAFGVDRLRHVADDVPKTHPAAGHAGELDRFVETAIGGRAAVDGDEDVLVHGGSWCRVIRVATKVWTFGRAEA